MFTGIIEEIGTILTVTKGVRSSILTIRADAIMDDVKIGDSIAVNGICLTVTEFTNNSFRVDVMSETLSRTSLSGCQAGTKVNLERAMAMNGRFGGHIVSGHIDGNGTIKSIKKDDNAVWFSIVASKEIMKYIIEKGSITIDGISLTIAQVGSDHFKVSIIPHTLSETILGMKQLGDPVNLENDLIGKYIEKLCNKEKKSSAITMQFLSENGF